MRGPRRLILGLGLLCVVVGAAYAARSPGTYQDDDVDRYYMARHALQEPSLFLHAWGMPVPLLLDAVPARAFGYPGVEGVSVVLAAGAAVLAGLAAVEAGLAAPWLAVIFLFFQPMVLRLSFSGMAEPAAAAILAGVLWFWYTKRRGAAVALSGWLPLARIDAGALTLVILIAGWRRSSWTARVGALLPAAIWSGLTWLTAGDPLGILGGGNRPLNSLGPAHYVRNLGVTAGPVVVFCFLWALVTLAAARRSRKAEVDLDRAVHAEASSGPRRGKGRKHRKAAVREPVTEPGVPVLALVLVLVHLALLSLLAWEALPVGRSIGFLRHVVTTAPALALVAVWGAGRWLGGHRMPAWRLIFAAGWTAVVAFLLSRKLIADTFLGETREEWRWITTGIVGLLGIPAALGKHAYRHALVAVLGAGTCVLSLATVPTIQLDPERQAIQTAVEYIQKWNANAVVYTNHPWFVFLTGRDRYDTARTPALTLEALKSAPAGSFVLWENHYGTRLSGDVPLETLKQDPRFERMLELEAGLTKNFHVAVFRRRP